MKPLDDELFAHIKERLTEHEEAYLPGAWERFGKKEEKKKFGWLWLGGISSAAAVLLIGFFLFYTGDKHQKNNGLQQQVKNTSPVQQDNALTDTVLKTSPGQLPAKTAIENLETSVAENKNIVAQRINNHVPNDPVIVSHKQPAVINKSVDPLVQPFNPAGQKVTAATHTGVLSGKDGVKENRATSVVVAKTVAGEKDSVKTNKPRSFQEFLDAEVKSNSAVAATKSSAKKADKWEMGLMVAPSMGNAKKLNMGYGFSMDYALSNKVSISSGISYNEMGATKSLESTNGPPNSPSGAVAMVSETKSLKSVDANLVGIDIPLGIKYHLSKKLYTNFGVSAFAVLNQKQSNNYLQGSLEYAEDVSNTAGFKSVFQQQTISEEVPSGEIRGNKYLGFYNVSFGFKQPISGSKAFSVEPFMKLPMKEFTKENLYLIGTGIRLKFDF